MIHYEAKSAKFPRLSTDTYFINEQNSARFCGVFEKSIRFIVEEQLYDERLWSRFVEQFKTKADDGSYGWRGEYWGKTMRGACYIYSYTEDARLYATLERTVRDLLSCADKRGRIASYSEAWELDGWDMWSRKYVLLGMQYFLEICKDKELSEQIVASMCRQVDAIMDKVGEGKEKSIYDTSRNWQGLNSTSILEPVVRLYNLTQEQKYLDFAAYLVKMGACSLDNLFALAYADEKMPYQYPATKAYELTSCFDGLMEYYRATKDEKYKKAAVNYAYRLLETDVTVVGSAGCTMELLDHSAVRQANTNNRTEMQETCVTVTLMKFFSQALLLTGDVRFADAYERAFYNAYLGAFNTDRVVTRRTDDSGRAFAEILPFDSYSPLTSGVRGVEVGGLQFMRDGHFYGCCAAIGAAGSGLFHKMACLTSKNGILLNLYEKGEINTFTPDGKSLSLSVDTAYPVDGRITLTLALDAPETFEIALRIPEWSEESKIEVENQPILTMKGYNFITRTWHNGDKITLTLDMRTEILHPTPYGEDVIMGDFAPGTKILIPVPDKEDPLAHRHVALRRGPLLLAQDARCGYSPDVPITLADTGKYANVTLQKQAPYPHILALTLPLSDGTEMLLTDYASVGKTQSAESKMAVWIFTE